MKSPGEILTAAARSRDGITAADVVEILAAQRGNEHLDPAELGARWVTSERFVPMVLHAAMPELGIHPGTRGPSFTQGPIIVDDNESESYYSDETGQVPRFIVLDGQHRLLGARCLGPCATIEALVGDRIVGKIRMTERKIAIKCRQLDNDMRAYRESPSPGSALRRLQLAVEEGFLSAERLEELRAQWRQHHGK